MTSTFYSAVASRYDTTYAIPPELTGPRLVPVLEALMLPAGAHLLDLGVGTGREIADLEARGLFVVGVDNALPMLQIARAKHPRTTLVYADMFASLPFRDASFDGAIGLHGCLSNTTSVTDLYALGRELHRVVRPGGRVVLEEPSFRLLVGPAIETDALHGRPRGAGTLEYLVTDKASGETWTGYVWPAVVIRQAMAGFEVEIADAGPSERLIVGTR